MRIRGKYSPCVVEYKVYVLNSLWPCAKRNKNGSWELRELWKNNKRMVLKCEDTIEINGDEVVMAIVKNITKRTEKHIDILGVCVGSMML